MSPDLSRQQNNLVSQSKARASQAVMERTEQSSAANANRNELRAFSQRLERMLRDRREAEASGRYVILSQRARSFSYTQYIRYMFIDCERKRDLLRFSCLFEGLKLLMKKAMAEN
jgi:hypothetical protein